MAKYFMRTAGSGVDMPLSKRQLQHFCTYCGRDIKRVLNQLHNNLVIHMERFTVRINPKKRSPRRRGFCGP